MNGRHGTCKGACCKTPFGVCAKANNCACHWRETNRDKMQEAIEEGNRQQRRIRYQDALKDATPGQKQGLYNKQTKGKI